MTKARGFFRNCRRRRGAGGAVRIVQYCGWYVKTVVEQNRYNAKLKFSLAIIPSSLIPMRMNGDGGSGGGGDGLKSRAHGVISHWV